VTGGPFAIRALVMGPSVIGAGVFVPTKHSKTNLLLEVQRQFVSDQCVSNRCVPERSYWDIASLARYVPWTSCPLHFLSKIYLAYTTLCVLEVACNIAGG
jgi:hypothetical protein